MGVVLRVCRCSTARGVVVSTFVTLASSSRVRLAGGIHSSSGSGLSLVVVRGRKRWWRVFIAGLVAFLISFPGCCVVRRHLFWI